MFAKFAIDDSGLASFLTSLSTFHNILGGVFGPQD